jgi:catechol 2,3-dioxygenase
MSVGVRQFEHVELGVPNVDEAVAFYRDVVGMADLGTVDGTTYLGFGLDDNYDLALTQGEGIRHFAFRVETPAEIDAYAKRLDEHGIAHERRDGTERGQQHGIRFELPSGHPMEFVTVADHPYPLPSRPVHARTSGFRPIDNDHIGLMTQDVKGLCEFFRDVLGFRISDYVEPEEGSDFWVLGFVRNGAYHHDISIAVGDKTLHHYAVTATSFEHMKDACDMLAAAGQVIELGPGRHPAGSNLFLYVVLPDGHRLEFSAEMAFLHDGTPTRRLDGEGSLDAWGDTWKRVPPHFYEGS